MLLSSRPLFLVVEDDADDAALLQQLLLQVVADSQIHVETSLASAINWLGTTDHPPTIIFTDVRMADAEGEDAAQAIHNRVPDIPLIVVSGQQMDDSLTDRLDAFAVDILHKDALPDPLAMRVLLNCAIQRQHERDNLARVLESQPDGIVVVSRTRGLLRYINGAARAVFDPAQALNINDQFGIPLANSDYSTVETAGGRILRVTEVPVRWNRRDCLMASFHDVTEMELARRKLSEQRDSLQHLVTEQSLELSRSRSAAEAGGQAREEFLSTLSHELRTPMNGIIGVIQLLEPMLTDQDTRDWMHMLSDSAEQMLSQITQMLAAAELHQGRAHIATERFSPGQVLRNITDHYSRAARNKGLAMHLELDDRLPGIAVGDPDRLWQALNCLVSNAIKFTESGSVTVRGRVAPGDDQSLQLVTEVIDTGPGISPEQAPYIYDHFRQLQGGTTRPKDGIGIGLSIVRELATLMGGQIELESTPGTGSTFRLVVTLGVAPATSEPEVSDPFQASSLEHIRVLLVEDDAASQVVLLNLLQGLGCEVEVAQDGREALDRIHRTRFDLILMDYHMPGMDGIETTRAIRAAESALGNMRRIPIIALTADAKQRVRDACLSAGMDHFLGKPISRDELVAAITVARRRYDETPEGTRPLSH